MLARQMTGKSLSEEHIIKLFRKHCPDFPKGKLIKSESPDFIIKTSTKYSIGIELTQIEDSKNPSPKKYITKEMIESAIRRKDEKLSLYQKKILDAYWLILVAGQKDDLMDLKTPSKICNWAFETNFHKIYLFILSERRVIELFKLIF